MPAIDGLTGSKVADSSTIGHPWVMMYDPKPNRRPNPLHPDRMTAHERRAELCRLLALGLIRLSQRDMVQLSDGSGESSLHYPANQSVHAAPTHRRIA